MENNNEPERNAIDRRKRVNRFKKNILITLAVMVIVPFVMCFVLLFRVNSLENKIDELIEVQSSYISSMETVNNGVEKDNAFEKVTTVESNTTEEKTSEEKTSEEETTTTEEVTTSNINSEEETTASDTTKRGYGKTVYLTFDDGPSGNTDKILEILDKYNVKATFFVCGYEDEASFRRYKAIVDSGNAIGIHSYTHDYDKIYGSLEAFIDDVTKVHDVVYRATGVDTKLYRFPGGSANSHIKEYSVKECIRYLLDNGYQYYDWNVSSEDATGKGTVTVKNILDGVNKHIFKWNTSIVLMHDSASKTTTVEALPILIEMLLEEGFTIKAIDKDTKPIQMILSSSVIEKQTTVQ